MAADGIIVRPAELADAEELTRIYDYYVKNTAISFEVTTPTVEEFSARMRDISKRYPYLVILRDGVIEGYAYAHAFIAREAYDRCCEMTIYLKDTARGSGLGRKLYEALENELKAMGIINLYACIGVPDEDDEYLTTNSRDFHEHLGYKTVGTFRNSGRKFGRWYSMIWMEKLIGAHTDRPSEVLFKDS